MHLCTHYQRRELLFLKLIKLVKHIGNHLYKINYYKVIPFTYIYSAINIIYEQNVYVIWLANIYYLAMQSYVIIKFISPIHTSHIHTEQRKKIF